jgi:hypothetical protein
MIPKKYTSYLVVILVVTFIFSCNKKRKAGNLGIYQATFEGIYGTNSTETWNYFTEISFVLNSSNEIEICRLENGICLESTKSILTIDNNNIAKGQFYYFDETKCQMPTCYVDSLIGIYNPKDKSITGVFTTTLAEEYQNIFSPNDFLIRYDRVGGFFSFQKKYK